jgi:AraC-like DNA-binding protein
VRKIFHDKTGETIVTFINNFRINEAKRLLRETDLNINEIALRLGYNNNQSFNRFFKKYEGSLPVSFGISNPAKKLTMLKTLQPFLGMVQGMLQIT